MLPDQLYYSEADCMMEWGWKHNFDAREGLHRKENEIMSTTFKCIRCGLPVSVADIRKSDGLCDSCDSGPDLAAAPAGGAEPACPNCGGTGVDGDVGDRGEIVETPCACRSTAPTAQPQPAEYLPQTWVAAVAEECGVGVERMSCLFDFAERVQRAARLAASQPTLLNGLTEQETAASASVAGLSGAQPEAPAEPSDNPERDEFYRVFNESAKLTGHQPTLYDVWLMARGRMDTSHRTIAPDMQAICAALGFDPTNHHNAAKCPYCRPTAPAAQQPAELTIRCPERLKNGGSCPHHNLHCGWPACNEEK